MYILNTPTRKLQVLLGGSVSTELDVVCHYEDIIYGEEDEGIAATTNKTTGTTPVDVVPAPQRAGAVRRVEALSVYNNNSADVTLTIRINDNATLYNLLSITLATGQQLYYEDQFGWAVLTEEGHLRSV